MEAGVLNKKYEIIEDRKKAIYQVISEAKAGDVVLIAGKGHETYQIIGERTLEFDDRKVALEAIQAKKKFIV